MYKDHTINVTKTSGVVHYSVFDPEGCEVLCSFMETDDTVRAIISCLKHRVDGEIVSKHPWSHLYGW